jgi:hypothetical protein
MFRIALDSDHSFLLLAPRWSGWGETGQMIALAALFLVPMLLILGLYRYELKLVSRAAATSLLLLRASGLFVLWCLVGLQPTVAHVERAETPSRVLVALDVSASMNLTDPQRPWTEKLRLAEALHIGPDAALLSRWIEARMKTAQEIDSAQEDLGRTIDQLTRKEITKRLLAEEHRNLLGRLKAKHQVEVIGFHRTVLDSSAGSLTALFQPADQGAGSLNTNLDLPLQRALQPAGANTSRLLGVMLLTDGQHNQGLAPLALTKELARQEIPIYPVAIGSRKPPVDVAIVDLQAPKQVFKDAEANVEAKIRATGLPAQELLVELTGSGKFAKQEKRIHHDGKDRVYTASFPIKLEEAGSQRLEVRARPQDPQTREITTDNNHLATVIRVAPEKVRVLIVEDEPRWEYYYLATALARDQDLQLDRVLFSQPRIGAIPEETLEKLGHARRNLPAQGSALEDPLWQYDCILLGDVAPDQLPPPDRQRLERYVADRGGTLVVGAGKRYMPLSYFDKEDDSLVKLLPVRAPHLMQPRDGFALTITETGEKNPFFQIDKDAATSKERWTEMPKHFWGVAGTAKPGAVVLARAASSELPAFQKKDSSEDAAATVLQQPYGFGKVLYIGVDSTWRWRYRVGDLYHHRFWGQLVRWAVSDPWLPEGNRYVRYGAKAPIYRHDQEIELAARLGEETPVINAATARMKLIRKEGDKEAPIAAVPLLQDSERKKQWIGKIKRLPPGTYQIELDVPELRAKLPDAPLKEKETAAHGFTVLPPEDGELIDVATNWDLLQALADQTGGRLFTAEDADQLPDLLARQVERKESRREERVWQDIPMVWWVLGLLLTLLAAEWTLRKLSGLP